MKELDSSPKDRFLYEFSYSKVGVTESTFAAIDSQAIRMAVL